MDSTSQQRTQLIDIKNTKPLVIVDGEVRFRDPDHSPELLGTYTTFRPVVAPSEPLRWD